MLAACSSPAEMAEDAGQAKPAATTAAATTTTIAATAASATSADAGVTAFADNASKNGGTREFAYTWPAAVSAVPALVDRFTAERGKLLVQQKADWAQALREFANGECIACLNRSFEKTWEVAADSPRFLSLVASFYEFTGGAHGNGAYDALVWDREAKAAIDPKAMFRSDAALQAALGEAWCKALKIERAERLGGDYADESIFTCPPIADLTVLPVSSGGTAFDRIELLAAPYIAGSYVEGTYEVTLPVTPAVLAAVKPDYKSAFVAGK